MRKLPSLLGAFVAIGALVGGVLVAPAALAVEASPTREAHLPIQAFQSLSSLSEASRHPQTISFDELEIGISAGNPASFGPVNVLHSSAATFKTVGSPYAPVSSPNVLAPFRPDGTLELGDTTLSFAKNTRLAGLFLIIPAGSNQDTIWTSTVTATDTKDQSITVTITFRGVVGEQQFIGFESQHKLVSISFGPAINPEATSVVALDDIVVD
jgi:hypothetical protein